MRRHLFSFVAVACSLAICEAAAAQTPPPLDRIVGADVLGRPLVITALTGISVGALAAAAGVPMGLEATGPATVQPWRVNASGQTVRAVLDAIVAADPRYEWRADNGVVVFRPVWAWTDMTDVLLRGVGSIKLEDVQANDVMRIVARLFGETLFPGNGPGDPKHFSVDLPPGSVIEALDGIVRAHGTMAWAFEPTTPTPLAPGSVSSPYTVSLIGGRVGAAFGVGVSANAAPPTSVDVDVDPSRPAPFTEPILDRIVRTKRNGQPLILESIFGVSELAEAAGVTMGIELLPATEPRALSGGIQVTGMSLRDALSAFTAADSRYEWRDMDGVVVIRPIAAWFDSAHPLSREVTGLAGQRDDLRGDPRRAVAIGSGGEERSIGRSAARRPARVRHVAARHAARPPERDRETSRKVVLGVGGKQRPRHTVLQRAAPHADVPRRRLRKGLRLSVADPLSAEFHKRSTHGKRRRAITHHVARAV